MTEFDLGSTVLALARSAIAEKLGLAGTLDPVSHARLEERSATFVTLKQAGGLRGCVGSLQAVRALRDDVRANAVAAAFRDPRFAPLEASELPRTSLEVSLLSAEERIEAVSEEELLPQVWEQVSDPRDFLAALKAKAGLPEDFWREGMLISRYAAVTWKEPEPALERA